MMGGQLGKEKPEVFGRNDDDQNTHSTLDETSLTASGQPQSEMLSSRNDENTSPTALGDLRGKLKKLIGNTEKLSASAQRVFALGKIYLTGNSSDVTQTDGFPALFHLLPENKDADLNGSREEEQNHCQCHHPGESCSTAPSKQSREGIRNISCAQTYVQWKAGQDLLNLNTLCFASLKTIYVQPLNDFPDFCTDFKLQTRNLTLGFFDMLQGFMQIFFSGMEIVILPPVSIDTDKWRVRSRRHDITKQEQYCVTDIFPHLQSLMPRNGHSIVGVIWTDLYPENFNFVLGETSYAHKSAVVSFGRFEPNNFDASSHQDVADMNGQVIWKLLRTLSHEVCHLFGLSHCVFFQCAMNGSQSLTEALSQPLFLCPVCLRKLQQACNFDVLERYQLLLKFIQSINKQLSDSRQMQDSVLWLTSTVEYLRV